MKLACLKTSQVCKIYETCFKAQVIKPKLRYCMDNSQVTKIILKLLQVFVQVQGLLMIQRLLCPKDQLIYYMVSLEIYMLIRPRFPNTLSRSYASTITRRF